MSARRPRRLAALALCLALGAGCSCTYRRGLVDIATGVDSYQAALYWPFAMLFWLGLWPLIDGCYVLDEALNGHDCGDPEHPQREAEPAPDADGDR